MFTRRRAIGIQIPFQHKYLPVGRNYFWMRYLFYIIATLLIVSDLQSQRVYEFSIKPFEAAMLNFETGFCVGKARVRYGAIFSYRPSTQKSGLVESAGSGFAGGYGQNHFNRLYDSYTIGLFQKTYLSGQIKYFLETDVFYRKWRFAEKYAKFENVEGYRFEGLRTERVNVYCIKLLFGRTVLISKRQGLGALKGIDIYVGVGGRYRTSQYETFNGTVNDVFYSYLIEKNSRFIITPQFGAKIMIVIRK
jgi:hypothetical protein